MSKPLLRNRKGDKNSFFIMLDSISNYLDFVVVTPIDGHFQAVSTQSDILQ